MEEHIDNYHDSKNEKVSFVCVFTIFIWFLSSYSYEILSWICHILQDWSFWQCYHCLPIITYNHVESFRRNGCSLLLVRAISIVPLPQLPNWRESLHILILSKERAFISIYKEKWVSKKIIFLTFILFFVTLHHHILVWQMRMRGMY